MATETQTPEALPETASPVSGNTFNQSSSYFGYPGDTDADPDSMKGNGAYTKPGGLQDRKSVALFESFGKQLGLKHGQAFVPSDGPFAGQTVHWDDRIPDDSPAPKNTIDMYYPDHPPDKGVSAAHVAHYEAIRAGAAPSDVPPLNSNLPRSGDLEQAQKESLPETASPFSSQPKRRAGPVPGSAIVDPVSEDEAQQEEQSAQNAPPEDQEEAYNQAQQKILSAHSSRLSPDDQRVALRVNPDTGSERLVGTYFVPGDPVHDRLLQNYGPTDLAKLPALSQAIQQGQPYGFNYLSAEQEGGAPEWEGERTTGESRQYETKLSSAAQRVAGEGPSQTDFKNIIPIQMVAGMPKLNQSPTVGVEGFGSQNVLNNAGHLISGAKIIGKKIPYQSTQDPNLHQDIQGYLNNQAAGYRGDGSSPALDETGQPNRLWQASQNKPTKYVPHLMGKDQAHFIHAALNIVPGKKKGEPGKAPSFGERAEWLRRTMEGFEGDKIGPNPLREELDRKLPKVARRSKVIDKKTGKPKILGYDPWTKGTLEPTWRRYRLELIQHEAPKEGAPSMRETSPVVHRAPHFTQTAAQHLPPAPLSRAPEPISGDPEVGAPLGEGQEASQHGLLSGEARQQETDSPIPMQAEPQEEPEEIIPGSAKIKNHEKLNLLQHIEDEMSNYDKPSPFVLKHLANAAREAGIQFQIHSKEAEDHSPEEGYLSHEHSLKAAGRGDYLEHWTQSSHPKFGLDSHEAWPEHMADLKERQRRLRERFMEAEPNSKEEEDLEEKIEENKRNALERARPEDLEHDETIPSATEHFLRHAKIPVPDYPSFGANKSTCNPEMESSTADKFHQAYSKVKDASGMAKLADLGEELDLSPADLERHVRRLLVKKKVWLARSDDPQGLNKYDKEYQIDLGSGNYKHYLAFNQQSAISGNPEVGAPLGETVPGGSATGLLAARQLQETGPARQTPMQPPVPPQEAVQQPMPHKTKKKGAASPTKGSPAELGAAAVQPPSPQGNF